MEKSGSDPLGTIDEGEDTASRGDDVDEGGEDPRGLDSRGERGRDNGWVGSKDCRALVSNLRTDIEGDGRMGSPGRGFVLNIDKTNIVAVGDEPSQCCTGWWKVEEAEEDATGIGCAVADRV